ncbi:hypothetical protein SEA_PETTERN_65 [Mycobacterium phage PetterN]|uniref:Uncharacterized protein n=8 Tax=Caudoviricetes TaxID=2731619 RepID=A0A2P1N274_9CAUD|nr:hypothetical protein O156_gp36 [Mycobacterium phage LittleCherry]YP_009198833.1 hypothetical protein AVT30_gp31 [Mycobacterium phage UnionJack]YP_009207726.1 hypothetical protein AVV06_gp33 [Mycobacterium phage Chadwick]YP_009208945.1 hypothetical protein AVV40_gp34 [Mycobacterium phage Swirley]YP_009635818.1 hypothetical protein FGG53_gp32 [Mycobacterium phage George]YP_009637966.1 hypothetical protein FGG33_gp34 [Mycobacterium phage Benedict]YP_009638146.1 hypothetical protein FGG35_gp34
MTDQQAAFVLITIYALVMLIWWLLSGDNNSAS